ncbi:MAG: diaminobutyrate--2-oxoglutarate transaminase [Gammaproteobacteria bacterium]|nr:diaminobutyrate--2-oxoglutarate transaminase [Gammaproteobacteria bacterium]
MSNSIDKYESEVRGYCRAFPVEFTTAKGAWLTDAEGNKYLDFFAGAGALNYGHNNDDMQKAVVDYLKSDGITHSLDMYSTAKREFLERFYEVILEPRGMSEYKAQFPGPTGTNAVEAALKLARKVTGRENILSFTNGFHGMTLGSLAVTGNAFKRKGAGVTLSDVMPMPFDGYLGKGTDTIDYIDAMLSDGASGIDKPAAAIIETVQGEGGVNAASLEWIKRLAEVLKKHDILLIVDDIQIGCGRSGHFFSFEEAGIKPDIITLSKSLSGYGMPFAMVLFKPEYDVWAPGEHNGTFRGFNPAFVSATKALDFWTNDDFAASVRAKSQLAIKSLEKTAALADKYCAHVRGRGLMLGIGFSDDDLAGEIASECFKHKLIIENAGFNDEVLKLLPSLTISEEDLQKGLDIIHEATKAVIERREKKAA